MLGTITPWGARGGGTVTTWCRPACINPQTARSPMNTASRSRLAIPQTPTLPGRRGFKLTHYIAHAPSGARPCAATARDPRRSLRDRDRCKPGGWPTPRDAELRRRDLGPQRSRAGVWAPAGAAGGPKRGWRPAPRGAKPAAGAPGARRSRAGVGLAAHVAGEHRTEPARGRPPQQRAEAERESAHAGRRGLGASEERSAAPAARAPDGPPESIDPCLAGGYLRPGNLHIPGNTHWRQRLSFPIFRGLRASGKERWA